MHWTTDAVRLKELWSPRWPSTHNTRFLEPQVIQCFVQLGQTDQIVAYVKKVGYQADYSSVVVATPAGVLPFRQ